MHNIEDFYLNLIKSFDEGDIKKAKKTSGGWITVNGKHVYIGSGGKVQAGVVYGKNGEKITSGGKLSSKPSKTYSSKESSDNEKSEDENESKIKKVSPKTVKKPSNDKNSGIKDGKEDKGCRNNPDSINYFSSYDASMRSLSPEETNALTEYRFEDYKSVNSMLRSGKTSDQTNYIDSAFNKIKSNTNIRTYHGLIGSDLFESFEEGFVFTDKAYFSVTINSESQDKFFENDGYLMEVRISKGSPVIPMQNVGSNELYDDECELLLPRDSRFSVVSKSNKTVIVELL